MAGKVETRVIIDADAGNAIREIDKLDTAAADADTTLKKLDGAAVTVDTGTAVTDLAAIDRAALDAKSQLDKLDAQTIHIDVDTDRLDAVKRSADGVADSGRASSTAIGGIGNSISELPGVGSLGPIAESFGQLAENALEGGESIAGIGKAVGVLGGTAAVMWGISKAMESIADTDAFNKEQAEDFRDALEEVKDEALAVVKVIEQAGGVKGRAGGIGSLFEGTKDITQDLLDAKVGADEFIAAVTLGGPALDHVVGKLKMYQDELKAQRIANEDSTGAALPLLEAYRRIDDAVEITTETFKNYSAQGDSTTTMTEFLATATDKTATAASVAKDRTYEFAAALQEQERSTDNARIANEKLRGDLDKRDAYLNLMDQFDELERKGSEAITAVHDKTDDADSKMRDYEQSVIDTKLGVLDYAESFDNVPTDVTTDLLAKVDSRELDTLKTDLSNLKDTRHTVYVDVYGNIDPKLLNSPYLPYIRKPSTRLTGLRDG